MGFVLFGEAGTFEFKPADYGLSPGDQCIVFCIGGGGGGASMRTLYGVGAIASNDGEASSFGTVLTAAGGAGGVPVTQTQSTVGSSLGGYSGGGGGGWYPGAPITGGNGLSYTVTDPTILALSRTCGGAGGTIQNMPTLGGGGAIGYGVSSIPVSGGRGSINGVGAEGGQASSRSSSGTNYPGYSGGGGAGYGAGGGCAAYGNEQAGYGGNGGEVRMTNVTISEATSVPVTVGAGGAASPDGDLNGGAGCNGCVCIVW